MVQHTQDPIDAIMEIVEEYESTDKSAMIKDLLCLMQYEAIEEVLDNLKNHRPLVGGIRLT